MSTLNLNIVEDRYSKTDERYYINFIDFISGVGGWAYPIGNNTEVCGMTKEQSVELIKKILETVEEYLTINFPDEVDEDEFKYGFRNINTK